MIFFLFALVPTMPDLNKSAINRRKTWKFPPLEYISRASAKIANDSQGHGGASIVGVRETFFILPRGERLPTPSRSHYPISREFRPRGDARRNDERKAIRNDDLSPPRARINVDFVNSRALHPNSVAIEFGRQWRFFYTCFWDKWVLLVLARFFLED